MMDPMQPIHCPNCGAALPAPALREGFNESNRLRVICKGDSFRVYLNGVFAGSFKDNQFSVGRVYLAVDPGEKQHGVFAFSDLQVREVPGR